MKIAYWFGKPIIGLVNQVNEVIKNKYSNRNKITNHKFTNQITSLQIKSHLLEVIMEVKSLRYGVKFFMALVLLVALVLGMVACAAPQSTTKPTTESQSGDGGTTSADGSTDETTASDGTTSQDGQSGSEVPQGDVKVGLIASAFGTQSYNDDVLAGVEKAKAELGVDFISLEVPEVTDTANSLRSLIAQGCNFIIVPSAEFRDGMEEVAAEYPDAKFLYLSEAMQGQTNIMSVVYYENEGAFLLGALAGTLTQSNNVGAVLAINGDEVQTKYLYGYSAGVKAVNPDAEVQSAYTNSYTDVNKGFEVAKVMYSKGADFVGTYAGACNLGVFNAAENAGDGKYAFGAAKGQFSEKPEKIVASLVKPIEEAIVEILKAYKETGAFDASKPTELGIDNKGVVMKYTTENDALKNEMITAEVQAMIDELTSGIADGTIVVPSD
jgi:basic membrane protein A